ncbi:hypothetical protein D9619_012380 [Psilocybe cf. subviscida]|uniref:Uncharacterized protein n=1 Tax=Psilocybe cf. subviscida TaxID=2480587 RepID=A0A8H5ER54_9AGAR|nr:hypothetical protein D9619_012380 [Psilocybe cf. subviscida]
MPALRKAVISDDTTLPCSIIHYNGGSHPTCRPVQWLSLYTRPSSCRLSAMVRNPHSMLSGPSLKRAHSGCLNALLALHSHISPPPNEPPSPSLIHLLESPRVKFVDLSYLDNDSGRPYFTKLSGGRAYGSLSLPCTFPFHITRAAHNRH